jgi:hypothetical protein
VPNSFVQFICQSAASTIISLEICILDDPVVSGLCKKEKELPPSFDEDNYSESSEDSDSENLDHEMVAPRPLAFLVSIDTKSFPALSQLWLCKTAQSSQEGGFYDVYFSQKSDRSVLLEWAALLSSLRTTSPLKHLTLEHRLVAPENESESTGSDEYMALYSDGPSNELFLEIVLPVLLEEDGWLVLEKLWFSGITMKSHWNTNSLQNRFVDVEVQFLLGKRTLFNHEDGTACNYQGGDCLGWKDFSKL